MSEGDRIPTIGEHRGVGLHDCQSKERLALVRREIDSVLDLHDITLLVEVAADVGWSPEARLLAASKLKAMHQISAEDRKSRPMFDMAYVTACVCSLDSRSWRSPTHFCSLLDPGRGPHEAGPVARDVPLEST
ncbi:hypothetical protein NKI94_19245 [Mesorhizobium australicum]|uniref:hypothetical protein n=1 Tax=Mesorhizobium australicum TaxID=536018 RepID=UPI00333C8CB5